MNILVTGGAGSLGKELVKKLLMDHNVVRVLDINEAELDSFTHPDVRKLYGNICDPKRVDLAMRNITAVIHTAALKNINISEKNPEEAIKTNILGTQNVMEASLAHAVPYNIFISSDKAVYPTTLYGTTKLIGEHLWRWAQQIQMGQKFCIIRPGNFCESRGNVFEVWQRQSKANQPLTITDERMARYFIRTDDAAKLVIHTLNMMGLGALKGGEIVVPKMQMHLITGLRAKQFPNDRYVVTGMRRGEKLIEDLVTEDEEELFFDEFVRVYRPAGGI